MIFLHEFPPVFIFSPLCASEYTNIFDSFLNITAVFQEKSLIYEENEEDKEKEEEDEDEDDVKN
jgi:hypothetical protein